MLGPMAIAVKWYSCIFLVMMLFSTKMALAQQAGSIRGIVYDKDFDVPLAAAQVSIAETGDKITATDEGNFVFGQVPPGSYTLVFSKDGYTHGRVQANVVVSPGKMTEVEASLSGEFTEMEEFVVRDRTDRRDGSGLLQLRVESPALLDSISSEWLRQAEATRCGQRVESGSGRYGAGRQIRSGSRATRPVRQFTDERRAPAYSRSG